MRLHVALFLFMFALCPLTYAVQEDPVPTTLEEQITEDIGLVQCGDMIYQAFAPDPTYPPYIGSGIFPAHTWFTVAQQSDASHCGTVVRMTHKRIADWEAFLAEKYTAGTYPEVAFNPGDLAVFEAPYPVPATDGNVYCGYSPLADVLGRSFDGKYQIRRLGLTCFQKCRLSHILAAQMGKEYDFAVGFHNGKWYCSEVMADALYRILGTYAPVRNLGDIYDASIATYFYMVSTAEDSGLPFTVIWYGGVPLNQTVPAYRRVILPKDMATYTADGTITNTVIATRGGFQISWPVVPLATE